MDGLSVIIPYKPRYPEVHQVLEKRRYCVIVAHRRFGKTVMALNHMIKMALLQDKPMGCYAFIAPQLKQAKESTWEYLKRYTAPLPVRKVNESEASIKLPSRGDASKIRVYGADNPDSLRGAYYDGVVMDEVAQMKPEVWGEVVRPMLADRKGWAVFIGTPKGVNLFSDLYCKALDRQASGSKTWAAFSFPYTGETTALSREEAGELREDMSENAWRQEMLCDFNAASDDSLISIETVEGAARRRLRKEDYSFSPVVLGVDVARFGDDASVIFPRQGLFADNPIVLRKTDNMALADRIAFETRTRDAQAVFIDAGGGAGVIDRLRQLGHAVIETPFGGAASKPDRYVNRRMEMWSNMAEWLKSGTIPDDAKLKAELSAPTFSFDNRGLMKLESKDRVKERLARSPDLADALALTFAMPVAAKSARRANRRYDPLAWRGAENV